MVDSKFCVHTISDTIVVIEAAAIPVHLFTTQDLYGCPQVIPLHTCLYMTSQWIPFEVSYTYVRDRSCDLHMTCHVQCVSSFICISPKCLHIQYYLHIGRDWPQWDGACTVCVDVCIFASNVQYLLQYIMQSIYMHNVLSSCVNNNILFVWCIEVWSG